MKKLLSSIFRKKDHYADFRYEINLAVKKIQDAVNSDNPAAVQRAIPLHDRDQVKDCIRKWLPLILRRNGLSSDGYSTGTAVKEAIGLIKLFHLNNQLGIYDRIAGELYECFTGMEYDEAVKEVRK